MARTVYIELPDGGVESVTDVPDNIKDDQVASRYGGKLLSTRSDIIKGAASGAKEGLAFQALAPGKISVGMMGGLANLTGNKDVLETARYGAQSVQRMEQLLGKVLGERYDPKTRPGEWSKSIAAGAAQLPVTSSLPANVINTVVGGTGGAMAQGARETGLGESGAAVASTIPWLLLALKQGLTPNFGRAKAGESVAALTPEQRAVIQTGMLRGQQAGVDPMPWQVAPEGSQLRQLGLGAAKLPGAEGLQARVTQQLPGHRASADQGAIQRVVDPLFTKVNATKLGPGQVETISEQMRGVARERSLPRAPDPLGKAVEREADRLGQYVDVKVPQQKLIDELTELGKQVRQSPTREAMARRQQLVSILGGTDPWPTTRVFQPNVSTVGEVNSIRGSIGAGEGAGTMGMGEGHKYALKKRVADATDLVAPDAGWPAARATAGEVKRAVDSVRSSAEATAGKTFDPVNTGAKMEIGPELQYALATNFMWALVPPVRRWAQRQSAKQLDNLLQATSVEELARQAAYNPQKDALISALRAAAAPVQQDTIDLKNIVR